MLGGSARDILEMNLMIDPTKQITKIFKDRLLSNADLAAADEKEQVWFAQLGLSLKSTLKIQSGQILIADPCYLRDDNFYSSDDNPQGRFLKQNGVVLMNFGGDVSGPIIRCLEGGYKIILTDPTIDADDSPIFQGDSLIVSESFLVAEESPGVDSGGLVFIDYSPELREVFASQLQSLRDDLYFLLEVKPGTYWVGYEQWDIEPDNPYPDPAWYRNIVIMPVTTPQ
jgi:hypothetical protein